MRIEKARMVIVITLSIFAVFIPLLLWALFESMLVLIAALLGFCVIFYLFFSLFYSNMRSVCPICEDGHLREDYRDSPRGTFSKIKHRCNNCDAMFQDGYFVNAD